MGYERFFILNFKDFPGTESFFAWIQTRIVFAWIRTLSKFGLDPDSDP